MNPIIKKFIYLVPLAGFLGACDNIDMADRYIEAGDVMVARKVLLEEFTGQLCTNCPDAQRAVHSLEQQYGDNLIAVSIHAGRGTFGIPAPYGLMQEEGEIYAQQWGIGSVLPLGVVDRTIGPMYYEDFAAAVREEIGKTTLLELSLESQLSEDGSEIEVFTTLVSPSALNGNLQLWVIESNIVDMQIDNGKVLNDYVHNNVFRACVNGQWGENIPLEGNVVKYVSNTIPLDEIWEPENLAIVGFYYNGNGVVQVERCQVVTGNE